MFVCAAYLCLRGYMEIEGTIVYVFKPRYFTLRRKFFSSIGELCRICLALPSI
jgi:hypothetical protein